MIAIKQVLKAQTEYYTLINEYFKNDISIIENDLKESIKNIESYAFYKLLLNADLNIKKQLLNTILKSSILGAELSIAAARDVLLSIGQQSWFIDNLLEKIDHLFQENELEKDYKYFYYGNAAQLLYDLGFYSGLNIFLENYCKGSNDPDIKEIYEDFKK